MAEMILDDRIYETAVITGTGEYTLDGAPTGKQPLSVIGANNYAALYVTDDINWECGLYTYVAGPARAQRTHVVSSSNGDAAVNWNNATVKIFCAPVALLGLPRRVAKSVAGAANVTLTALEQRCNMLELTGVLTGNIEVIVDVTKWPWIVKNSTTGNFTINFKTAAGTGVKLPQGLSSLVYCDGTNVLSALAGIHDKTTVASATTPDIWTGTGPLIDYTGTAAATGFAQAPYPGAQRTLLCAAASSFTHGANLLAPGSVNYVAAAGDLVTVTAVTTTQFRLSVAKADGTTIAASAASDTAAGSIEIAVQSEMEAGSSNTLAVTPGRQHFHPSAAKFWGEITYSGGVPTLAGNYNITSIADTAVGRCTVTINTDFSSADWVASGSCDVSGTADIFQTTAKAAGTVELQCQRIAVGLADPLRFSVVGYGDQ